MTTFTYWCLGLLLAVLVGAALYDHRQNRRARQASPSATSKSDRRTAVRADRLEQAHQQDMASRQIPPTGYVIPYDTGGTGGG
jgi:predicted alpha-1,6-mannanase (GH76 family)